MDEELMKSEGKTVTDGDGVEYNVTVLQKLGNHLSQRFSVHKNDRRQQEQQWLRNLYQFTGKYDPDIESKLDPERSRAYPKLTRTKVMVIVARLMNLLFPQSDKSWEVRESEVPSMSQSDLDAAFYEWREENPEAEVTQKELDKLVKAFAKRAAENMERHLTDQLSDAMGSATETDNSDFVTLCRSVIISAAIFNVGILKGPMTLAKKKNTIEIAPGTTTPTVTQTDSYRPYFEATNVWNYYPDMQSRTFADMEGEFEEHIYTQDQLRALGRRPDFISSAIDKFIAAHPEGNFTPATHEQDLDNLAGNTRASNRGKRYRVQEFWGTVDKDYVKESGIEIPEEMEDYHQFRITGWVGGRHVMKLALNPLPSTTNIYHKFVFDDSIPSLMGGSMCEIMRDSQMAVSSAARMLIDNASVTCGPMLEIDLNKLVGQQDVKSIAPFRNYFTDQKNNPAGHRAINNISVDSHMNELLLVMDKFLQFSDMETFVGGYGDADNTPGEALRTTAGASMVMGNAALPFRDIVRSFDRFTVSTLNALVEWNRLFNEELEYIGDLRPVAKGATSMIAKELRAFALDNLTQTMTDEERLYVDDEKLLEQRMMARDIPFKDIRASDEEIDRKKNQQAQEAQEARDQAKQLFEAELREMTTDAMKNASQAKKNLEGSDATSVETMLKVAEQAQETVEMPTDE